MSDNESEYRASERKVDKVTRQTVGCSLDRRARLLCRLYRIDDLPEGCFTTDAGSPYFKRTRLIDRSGVNIGSCDLLHRHRLASNRCLINEGIAADDFAINRDAPTRLYYHNIAHLYFRGTDFARRAIATYGGIARQKVEQILNRPSATIDRQALEDFSYQHKENNHESGEELTDRKGGADGNGHRQFHRHPTREKRLKGFLQNWVHADERRHQADDTETWVRLPDSEPHGSAGDGHECDPNHIGQFQMMILGMTRCFFRSGLRLMRCRRRITPLCFDSGDSACFCHNNILFRHHFLSVLLSISNRCSLRPLILARLGPLPTSAFH